MKVCKAKKKDSSVLMKANLVKQMKYSTLIIKEILVGKQHPV